VGIFARHVELWRPPKKYKKKVAFNPRQLYIIRMKKNTANRKRRDTHLTVTQEQYDYALALSKRVPNCPRPIEGSIAHGFKWALCECARREGIEISIS
jgi:4'-phosphopantetheinyl transferase EntD